MKSLIIAEKPSVAGDIAAALGGFKKSGPVYERDDLVITNAIGHLVELEVAEADGKWGLEFLPILPPKFGLKVIDRTRDQYKIVEQQLKRSDIGVIINACDAGREGELIFGLIMVKSGCEKPVRRMWCQSMTNDSLREAFDLARPGDEYMDLFFAARSRSEADWLIGINGSRGLTALRQHQTGMKESVTAGRVQTPTLAIPVHREREIAKFVSRDFWEVVASFGVASGKYKGRFKAVDSQTAPGEESGEAEADASKSRFFDQAQAIALAERCNGQPVDSVEEEVKQVMQPPPKLFDLTTLQREANKRFKIPVKEVLDIAQSLYETHKMTTYPRTDSSALPEDYIDKVEKVMVQLEGSEWGRYAKVVGDSGWVKPTKRIFDNSKISDHHAIIPTGLSSDRLSPKERHVYDMIVRRFIAAFYPSAEFRNTKRTTVVAGEAFHSAGKVLIESGWLSVMQEVGEDGQVKRSGDDGLCALLEGETPKNEGVSVTSGRTGPPARYTEASLLAAMETAGKLVENDEMRAAMKDKGLGTPATRASTIETLLNDRDSKRQPKEPYLRREKEFLVPTPKAMQLIDFLEGCAVGFLASPQTTGDWEERLNRMARGEYERSTFMSEIKATTQMMVDVIRDETGKTTKAEAPSTPLRGKCPKCGSGVKAMAKTFDCVSACGFKVWREVSTRPISVPEMEQLLEGGTLFNLEGFYSSTKKRKFTAGLKLENNELKFVFDADPGAPPAKRLACLCPKCDGIMASRPALVECTECGFKVWREFSERKFTDPELDKLLRNGSLDNLNNFVSREKRSHFTAGVQLELATGKVKFVFPERR